MTMKRVVRSKNRTEVQPTVNPEPKQMTKSTVLEQTFLHVSGIGPATEAKLKDQGYIDWHSVLQQPDQLPLGLKSTTSLIETLTQSQAALAQNDIRFFIDHLPVKEQWRILATYFDRISYFDIETSGLSYDAYVTCIVCYHRGQLHTFVHNENLDDFLDLLDEVALLASFNGSSFDVPFLLRTYHIPELPCPHIDLRWQCYHQQHRGGLKHIEQSLGIDRPADLHGVDGAEAPWLWFRWLQYQDAQARTRLLRYCAADVLSLPLITTGLLSSRGIPPKISLPHGNWDALNSMPL